MITPFSVTKRSTSWLCLLAALALPANAQLPAPVAYYAFDEPAGSTVAADTGPNGLNATVSPTKPNVTFGVTGAPGGASPGGAVELNSGGGGYLEVLGLDVPTTLGKRDGTATQADQDYTLAAWIKPNSLANDQFFFGQATQGIHHGLRGGGKLHMAHWGNDHSANTTLVIGEWVHAAFKYDGASNIGSIYLNGVLDDSGTVAKDGPNGSGVFFIGNRNGGGDDGNGFLGAVDDAAIWNEQLTDAQILLLATGTSPVNTADTDGDGLPDGYELSFAGNLTDLNGDGINDFDGDGLPDFEEFEDTFTNPVLPDTDMDGATDGFEAITAFTDPLNPDTDGDSLLDGVETNNGPMSFVDATNTGTDPNALDTDGDTVPDGVEIALSTDPTDAASTPPATGLPIIDDFEDDIINTVDWMVDNTIPQGGASSTETGGMLTMAGRSHFVTVGQFDPTTVGGLCITGQWTFNTADDFMQILTRSDGLPSGGFGETQSGIEFFANADTETVAIRSRNGDHTIDTVAAYDEMLTLDTGVAYSFEIIDDGNGRLSLEIWETADATNFGVVSANLAADFSVADHVVFHNREASRSSSMSEISITTLTDTDADGMPDKWEIANGLVVGTNDAAGDNDSDFSSNLDEYLNFTDPMNSDTDGDTGLDGYETNTGVYVSQMDTGTHPLDPDSDNDGLGDGAETMTGIFVSASDTGTNPAVPDTDSDGFTDGEEVLAGSDPNSSVSIPVLGRDLLNYWCFEGDFSDSAADYAANTSTVDDDMTNVGGNVTLTAGGPLGTYGAFARDFLEAPDSADIVAAGESLTISAWFRVNAWDQSWQALVAHGEASDYRIARRGASDVLGYAGGTNDIPANDTTGPNVNDGMWHHVVATTEAGVETALYVDGTLVTTSTLDNRVAPNLTDNGAGRLMIGGNPNSGADAAGAFRAWNGDIDDVAMWGRAINAVEVSEIYTAGVAGTPLKVLLGGGGPDLAITDIAYNPTGGAGGMGEFTLTWPSSDTSTYGIFWSTDLQNWGADLDDSYPGDAGATSTSFTFDHPNPGVPELFFRIEQN